jgi:PAS domain S-box-containing protein
MIAAQKHVELTLRCLINIAEQTAQGIAIIDLSGTILFVNEKYAQMHGYSTTHELRGKPISIFHTQELFNSDVVPFIEETKRRGRLAGKVQHLRKDRSIFLTKTKMTAVTDENEKPFALIIFTTDITETNQPDPQWQRQQSRLEEQIERLTDQNKKFQQQLAEHQCSEEQLLESIIEAGEPDDPEEPIAPPFNPQELKALSELAKRLR